MPGSIVSTITAPPPAAGPSTDTGTAFIATIAEKGPVTPQLITNIAAAAIYGADTAYTNAALHLEAFFRLGGRRAWVNRIVGPTPVFASITLNGSGSTPSVKFTAGSYGDWGNNLRLAVIAGTASNIKLVLSATTGTLATSPITSGDLADKAAVLAYTGFSNYGAFTSAGAGTIPVVVAAANLTGGTDDHASITDTQRTAALEAFTRQKGPGQVLLPGDTRSLAAGLLGVHAAAFNRRGLYDLPDDPSAGTVAAAALALRSDTNAAKVGAVEPWGKAPAAISGGALRDLPYSIVQAATIARQDAVTGNPNAPAAGDAGIAGGWLDSLKYQRTDTEIATLTAAGVNVATDLYGDGSVRMYGNRTLTDPTSNALYLQLSNVRLDMLIAALGRNVADRFVHVEIDGKGQTAARYGGALTNMLKALPEGALFAHVDQVSGELIDPGYLVDSSTGTGRPNTPQTIAAMELHAVIAYRRSPGSELVYLDIVTYPTTQEF